MNKLEVPFFMAEINIIMKIDKKKYKQPRVPNKSPSVSHVCIFRNDIRPVTSVTRQNPTGNEASELKAGW